jgi:hypothetical protein
VMGTKKIKMRFNYGLDGHEVAYKYFCLYL